MTETVAGHDEEHTERHVRVHIDRKKYHLDHRTWTGAELRQMAGIAKDYDLWEEREGDQEDRNIAGEAVVHLREDMHFYSSQPTINPGGNNAPA